MIETSILEGLLDDRCVLNLQAADAAARDADDEETGINLEGIDTEKTLTLAPAWKAKGFKDIKQNFVRQVEAIGDRSCLSLQRSRGRLYLTL